jgi:anti-sigma regulatory factor (Ser/Thr protein kinase)
MEKTFAKSLGALDGVFDFLDEFVDAEAIGERDAFVIDLVVEELFTNMVKYSGGRDAGIALHIDRTENRVRLELTDFDSDPFDPTAAKPVDVNAPIEDRQPGGLGLHIVKQKVDELRYEIDQRRVTISVSKSLER